MISRSWHGAVPVKCAEGFDAYLNKTGVAEALSLPGNVGVHTYRQTQGDYEHFFMISYWESMKAVEAFAGPNPHIAVTYPEDSQYGLLSDPIVLHQEVQSLPKEFPLVVKPESCKDLKPKNPELTLTDGKNTDFRKLIELLDQDLNERYGDLQKQYNGYNSTDELKDVVLAYKDSLPVACGTLKEYDPDTVEIKRVFVEKAHRKQGLSKLILKELECLALKKGYSSVILETGAKQIEAIHLYQSSGYHRIPNYGPYIGNENDLCMKKRLK